MCKRFADDTSFSKVRDLNKSVTKLNADLQKILGYSMENAI